MICNVLDIMILPRFVHQKLVVSMIDCLVKDINGGDGMDRLLPCILVLPFLEGKSRQKRL